jgi:hypothetical protein
VTFNQIVWGVCIVLEILLLVRAARASLFKRFGLFYAYIASVLLKDLLSIPIYTHLPSLYGSFYWTMAVLLAAVSYGVLMEIYNQSLKNYPGVAKFFRVFLVIMFLVIAAKVIAGSFADTHQPFGRVVAELERNLRQLQGILLCCLLALLVYYKIAVGKNLRGLLLGYCLLIGTEIITRTFAFNPASGFDAVMRKVEPAFYAASLLIWTFTLWASRPEVVADSSCGIAQDYGRLAQETRMILDRARAHLARAARP